VDTSALAAIAFNGPAAAEWVGRLDGAALSAPALLRYEIESVARKKRRQAPEQSARIVRALALALDPLAGSADPATAR
jgi:hypothetical protein